jgi:NADH-quinone oxidoreductase subunit C
VSPAEQSPGDGPDAAPGPGLTGEALAAAVAAALTSGGQDASVVASTDGAGTACVDVSRERWAEAALLVRDAFGMDFLDWLSAADQPDADPVGVDVVLHVADSGRAGRRILLRTRVPDADLRLSSLTGVWGGTAWHERETFEMFGVEFTGFDDLLDRGLRPLLLPEGFQGTPLRKSFVLAARAVKPWPGGKEPGESHVSGAPSRRKVQPPGVPDAETWGPREPSAPGSAAGPDEGPGLDEGPGAPPGATEEPADA